MTGENGKLDDPTERDYPAVMLPDPEQVPRSEWDVNQRRKYIMALYRDSHSPKEINKTDLSESFGVSRRTIYNDIQVLREWFDKHLDKDFENIANRTIRWAIKELREQGKPKDAVDVTMDWQEFLQEEGEKEKQAEKYEIDGNADFMDMSDDSDD